MSAPAPNPAPSPAPPDGPPTGVADALSAGRDDAVPAGPQSLDPGIIRAWYLSGALTLLFIVGAVGFGDLAWLGRQDWYPLPRGAATALAFAIMLWLELWYPRRAWSCWSWELREHDVLLRFGIWWKTTRSVPRLRIQHVDVSRDPFDRMLGLASVTLYTAGSGSDDAEIPGLAPDTAERLREALLIRRDAAEDLDARRDDGGAGGAAEARARRRRPGLRRPRRHRRLRRIRRTPPG